MTRRGAAVGAAIGVAALASGCLSTADCASAGPAAPASCAAGIEYDGHFYTAWSDRLPASRGELLGDGAYPGPCDGGGGGGCGPVEAHAPVVRVRVWALREAPPDQVVVARSEGSHELVVHGRLHAEAEAYFRFTGGAWHPRVPRPAR